MSNKHRHSAGDPAGRGGQFRATRKAAADPAVELSLDDAATELDAGPADGFAAPHPTEMGMGQLQDMLCPEQPVETRREAARIAYYTPGLADIAAADPDPLVRANALYASGTSDRTRHRLNRDPDVARILEVIRQ